MEYDGLITAVRERAALGSDAEAASVLAATLDVLSQRLDADAGLSVASQLPEQLATFVRRESAATGPEDFGADEFVSRVAERSGAPHDVARGQVVATLAVIGEATGGALDETCETLPPDLQALFVDVPGAPGRL